MSDEEIKIFLEEKIKKNVRFTKIITEGAKKGYDPLVMQKMYISLSNVKEKLTLFSIIKKNKEIYCHCIGMNTAILVINLLGMLFIFIFPKGLNEVLTLIMFVMIFSISAKYKSYFFHGHFWGFILNGILPAEDYDNRDSIIALVYLVYVIILLSIISFI